MTIIRDCDLGKLNPTPPEASVKVFVESMNEALTRAQDLENRFRDICNAINTDLGEAEGPDIRAACNKVAARVEKVIKMTPVPEGALSGGIAPWVSVNWDQSCRPDSRALAACLDTCSGQAACEHDGKCGTLVGACNGTCTGGCAVRGTDIACNGECRGTCDMTIDAGAPQTCSGECVGQCKTPAWTGNCDKGCNRDFVGTCAGTCTGTCDGVPVGPLPGDAGSDSGSPPADAGDDGGGGSVDAGPPADAGPQPAPGGQDGNCTGICRGQCSSGASGSCSLPCTGAFSGGICNGAGNCVGTCAAPSGGCTTTCTGTCTAASAGACEGVCTGTCEGAVANGSCTGALDCQADDQCKLACGVKAALATKCPEVTTGDVRVVGDPALYAALKKHIGAFATLANEAALVKAAFDRVADRTPADFKSIGLVSDTGFRCVDTGIGVSAQVRESLNRSAAASSVLRGTQF